MAGLSAGSLDRYVTLQTATTSQDTHTGEVTATWTGTVIAAQWLPGASREAYYTQQRLEATVDGVFVTHYRTPVPTPAGSRIVWNSRTYDVLAVTERGRQAGLEIAVRARADR